MLLDRLQRQSGLSSEKIERLAATASKRYKVYTIPKRTSGTRVIEHPAREIKALQRWINNLLIHKLPVHPCATAYKRGASVRDNAERHINSNFTLRIDFKSFFPSFTGEDVESFLLECTKTYAVTLSSADISFITRVVCRNNRLTIGAPSSPALTNAMMYQFDLNAYNWCSARGMVYSRYADDLFISTSEPGVLNDALAFISHEAASYKYCRLRLNEKKTRFLSRRYHRSITGVVITSDRKISIGLARKRKLKQDIFLHTKGELPPEERTRLAGMLAFARDVEPTFYATLKRKYGAEQIKLIETPEAGGSVTVRAA